MNDCIFCKIARGEIPSYKIYENKEYLAFLDIFPSMKGQALIIPKKHYSYFLDVDDKDYSALMLVVKKVARAIEKTLKPVKMGVIIEGFDVDHVHVKLYPLNHGFPMRPLENRPSEKEFGELAEKIKREF